jgi:hypothetical protein
MRRPGKKQRSGEDNVVEVSQTGPANREAQSLFIIVLSPTCRIRRMEVCLTHGWTRCRVHFARRVQATLSKRSPLTFPAPGDWVSE